MKRFAWIIASIFLCFTALEVHAQDSLYCEQLNYKNLGDLADKSMYAFYNKKEFDKAIEACQLKIEYFSKAQEWKKYIRALNDLAFLYNQIDDLSSFKAVIFDNFAQAEKYLTSDDPQWLRAKEQINSYYYNIGDYQSSLDVIKEVIPIKEEMDMKVIEISKSYLNLGTVYNKMKDYENALSSFKKSISVLSTDEDLGFRNGELYNNIARSYRFKGEIDSALHYLELSEKLFEKIGEESHFNSKKMETFILQVDMWLEKENYDQAKYYLTKAKSMGLSRKDEVRWNERYAKYYQGIGKFREAKRSLLKASEIARVHNVRYSPPLRARRALALGNTLMLEGNQMEALTTFHNALLILAPSFASDSLHTNPSSEQFLDKAGALAILQEKARILYDQHQKNDSIYHLSSAFDTYLSACEVIKEIRQGIRSNDSKNELSERTISVYEEAIGNAYALYEQTGDKSYLKTAFQLAESNKAQLLLESLNEQAALGFSGIPDSLAKKEKSLRLFLAALEDKALRDGRSPRSDENIFKLKEELSQFSSFLEKSYPRYFEQKYNNDPVDATFVQEQILDGQSALIEYFVGTEKMYVFVLTKDNIAVIKLNATATEMDYIGKFRSLLKERPGSKPPKEEYAEFVTTSKTIYDSFLKVALDILPESVKNLTIIPDDRINYIPFEVLIREEANRDMGYALDNQHYLMEDFAIHYNYSATLLNKVRTKDRTDFQSTFIGYAPTFDTAQKNHPRSFEGFELTNLKCSKDEIKSIHAIVGGERRINEAASKENFMNEVKDFKIVHLATHAFVNQNNSKMNRIFLQDDYLSEVNLYNLELNTELAVLSACNTGSGELLKGEGVMNLARGFINAGCSSTLMSMWAVDDCTTSELMQLFYQELKKGVTKDKALQQAKIQYLTTAKKTKRHPYYWAAFIPFGDMEALELGHTFSINAVLPFVLVICFVLGYIFFYRKKRKAR